MLLTLLATLALADTSTLPIDRTSEDYGDGWFCGDAESLSVNPGVTYSVAENYVIALEDIEVILEGRHRSCEVRISSAEIRVDGATVWSVSPDLRGDDAGSAAWWISRTYTPADITGIVLPAGSRRVELVVRGTGENDNTAIRGTLRATLRFGRDWDGDGYTADLLSDCDTDCSEEAFDEHGECPCDCDDGDAAVNPGADEIPADGADQDCTGTELCYRDSDDDGFRLEVTTDTTDLACAGAGLATAAVPTLDCDDTDPAIYPGATEIPGDGTDSDCDLEELCFADGDGDGWRTDTTTASRTLACDVAPLAPASMPATDCDDDDPTVNPDVDEIVADGVDQDCDDLEVCYVDGDDDGWRTDATVASSSIRCDGPGLASATVPSPDCDDEDDGINPDATERWYDGIDQDCDGASDFDQDGDGFDADAHAQPDGSFGDDCDDLDPAVKPGATEIYYDGTDQDCDGASDFDQDGDGHDAYDPPGLDGGRGPDCDDSDPDVVPGSRGYDETCGPRVEQDGTRALPASPAPEVGPTGCACAASGGGGAHPLVWIALVLAGVRRRRATQLH